MRFPILLIAIFCFSFAVARLGHKSSPQSSFNALMGMADNCTTCKNGASCCYNEVCCQGGQSCCPAGTSCCNDTCCAEGTQACCPDPVNGGICCMSETTFCCPPAWSFPSRCCPRWFVCCEYGRYGCCDPRTGKPLEDIEESDKLQDTTTAYALYVDSNGAFASLTIDLTTGTHEYKAVTGFNDWDEITREFKYDPNRNVFYLLQANFTESTRDHVITLYTVDPKSGIAKSKIVKGATEPGQSDVTGYEYVNNNNGGGYIIMSTQSVDSNDNLIGYKIYKLDIDSGIANIISNCNISIDSYCGWFGSISIDGKYIYRVGYLDVVHQINFGLSITDISSINGVTQWIPSVPIPQGLGYYLSLNIYGDSFISLSPDTYGNLNVVMWNWQKNQAKILMTPDDAYNTPYFGPIIEYINNDQSKYAALVVYDSDISENLDRWSLIVIDLSNGKSVSIVLWPWILAEITSMSALGFA